jgi:hypothetical protein
MAIKAVVIGSYREGFMKRILFLVKVIGLALILQGCAVYATPYGYSTGYFGYTPYYYGFNYRPHGYYGYRPYYHPYYGRRPGYRGWGGRHHWGGRGYGGGRYWGGGHRGWRGR